MKWRPRLTVRALMITVAAIAVGLGGIAWLRRQFPPPTYYPATPGAWFPTPGHWFAYDRQGGAWITEGYTDLDWGRAGHWTNRSLERQYHLRQWGPFTWMESVTERVSYVIPARVRHQLPFPLLLPPPSIP